jgi:hypothetical protein
MAALPRIDRQTLVEISGIPPGCDALVTRFRWSFPGEAGNDHRLPSANPPG